MTYRKFLVVGLGLALSACGGKDRVIGGGASGAGGASGGTAGSGGNAVAGAGGATGGSSGSGGISGAGNSGAVGGVGGGAGGPTGCTQLTETGKPLRIDGIPLEHETRPQLLSPRSSVDPVTLVYSTLAAEGPKQILPHVRHATFDGINPWPAEFFGTGYMAMEDGGFDFTAASGAGQQFAVLARREIPIGTSPMLSGDISTHKDNTTPAVFVGPMVGQASSPAPVRFISEGSLGATASEYLIGYEWPAPNQLVLSRAVWNIDGSASANLLGTYGCATAPVYADAFYSTKWGFIAVVTSSRPPLACMENFFADGPPTRIQVYRFPAQGEPQVMAEFKSSLPIDKFFLSPTVDGGAWITWQGTGGTKLDSLHAARIDASGAALTGALMLTDVEVAHSPIAASALGNRLAVAWTENAEQPLIAIRVFDEKTFGNTPTHAITPSPAFSPTDGISIAGTTKGDQLYLSWSSEVTEIFAGPSGSEAALVKRIFTNRLDCRP